MPTPTPEAIIGTFINGRNSTQDFLQLKSNNGGNIFGWIDSLGHLQGSLLFGTGTPGGANGSVQFNNGGVLFGDSGFVYTPITAAVAPATLFIGVPNSSFSSNIQPSTNAGAGLQVNRLIPATGPDSLSQDSGLFVFQSNGDFANDAFDIAADFTNAPAASIVGLANNVFFNTPATFTNNNIQTGFEGSITSYGAGTTLGNACFYSYAENTGTGTVNNLYGFIAVQNQNSGGGTVNQNYGYHSDTQAGVGNTLNAAFHADDQGTAHTYDYAFYSAGGQNLLAATATTAVLNLTNLSPATGGGNFNSPLFEVSGNYWNGSASAVDKWTVQNVLGTGTNPSSALTFLHTGSSSGTIQVIIPNLAVVATLNAPTVNGSQSANFAFSTGSSGEVLNVLSVATSVGAVATYSVTIPGGGQPVVGQYVTIAGFTTSANNGRFITQSATSGSPGTIVLYNASAVSETHSATATIDQPIITQNGFDAAFNSTGNSFSIQGTTYSSTVGFEALPNFPNITLQAKGDATDAGYLRILNSGGTGSHGLEIGGIIDGTGAAPVTLQLGHFGGSSQAVFSGSLTIAGATPTGSAGQVGFGNTAGFGTGSAGTAVTTTTKGGGTGPTTPQTVVNYLEIDIAGIKYWMPLVQ